jgi:hypothetical protein
MDADESLLAAFFLRFLKDDAVEDSVSEAPP